jgi:hypothetical protein
MTEPGTLPDDNNYRELAMVLPTWARRCLKVLHNVSLFEKADGRVEVFCGDCYQGAGRGEILTVAKTKLLVAHFSRPSHD